MANYVRDAWYGTVTFLVFGLAYLMEDPGDTVRPLIAAIAVTAAGITIMAIVLRVAGDDLDEPQPKNPPR